MKLRKIITIMKWTALNVVMLITTFAAAEEGGAHDTKQPDGIINEFATNYGEILKELQACGVPSKNMFVRPVLKDGTPQGSDFDRFCYFEAKENQMSLFLCRNYKSVVDNYYGQYCQDPDRAPLDTSVQYLLFAQTPSETCKTLLATVVYGTESGTQPLFTSTESCEETCHQSLFCTNLAYLLSIRQPFNSPPGENENPAGSKDTEGVEDTPADADKGEGDGDGVPKVEGEEIKNSEEANDTHENDLPGNEILDKDEDEGNEDLEGEKDTPNHVDLYANEIPGVEKGEDLDNGLQPLENGLVDEIHGGDFDVPPGATGVNPDENGGELFPDSRENEKDNFKDENEIKGGENDDESSPSESESSDDAGGGNPFGDMSESSDDEGAESEQEFIDPNMLPGLFDQPAQHLEDANEIVPDTAEDKEAKFEKEMSLLEEQADSSHFLAYSLTAIILIMVTYILYHNKQKIVAIIIEGRNAPNGKRRRYNQNVYTTVDEMA